MADIAEELLEESGYSGEDAQETESTGEEESSTPEQQAEETEAEVEEKTEADESEDTEEPEKSEEPEKAEEPGKPDPQESAEWTYAMGKAERAKRQKAEERVKALESQLADLEGKAEQEPRPDVFDDQDGAFSHERQAIQNELLRNRVEMSQEFMRMQHDDYDSREAEFGELAKDSPELWGQLRNHPFPAKFAYEIAVKHARLKDMENVDEYKAKLEAEIRQKVEKEYKSKAEEAEATDARKREAVTPSLASQKSAEAKRESVDGILEELFPHTL